MRIINLIENTHGAEGCLCEHGLSFYVEMGNHTLLVDTGASEAFIANAEKLGLDLKKVDTVVISHGHYDHAGGVLAFAELNPSARIWIQSLAGEEYYHKNAAMEKIRLSKTDESTIRATVATGEDFNLTLIQAALGAFDSELNDLKQYFVDPFVIQADNVDDYLK